MKKFRFPLEKLRAWRRSRFEAEEARLQALLTEQRRIQHQRERLVAEMDASLNHLAGKHTACAEELVALNSFCLYAQHEERRLEHTQRQVGHEIDKQREQLLKARRDVEVLDRLREKRLGQWRVEADKEQENLVAELVVARWKAAGR
jgi:flagellar export protein FliJ